MNKILSPKAYDVLKTLSADELIRHRARMREQSLTNEAIIVTGERKKVAESIARKMLAKGMDINEITELTGLKINEVEKLKHKLQDVK